MRVRITATVALLVAGALTGAGLIAYAIEAQRLEQNTREEVAQEIEEFRTLQQRGIDPSTGEAFTDIETLLATFLRRNVPDEDELLVGWVGDEPRYRIPDDDLVLDPTFLEATRPLVTDAGSTRIDADAGEVLITTQPVRRGERRGALVIVNYLGQDRAELLATMRTYTVVSALSLLLITAVAFAQAGRLLRPLRALRRTADEIGETDLSQRLPVTGNDDITALTRTFNSMLDRLESAFVGQREFLDDAGHELKTPLTVLRGHLELLDVDDPSDVAETKQLLLDEIDRMSRLVGDLLLLAKSARPDFVTPAPTDLEELTHDVLTKARALGDRRWGRDATATGTVPLDRQRVVQAMLQLAHNAVKHTSPTDTVALGSAHDGDVVRLWVRDTGPGVPDTDRELVFERFGRSRSVDTGETHEEGFGLGLSIVAAIVAAHDGTVQIRDADPPGALVEITLPVGAVPEATGQAAEEHEETTWPAS